MLVNLFVISILKICILFSWSEKGGKARLLSRLILPFFYMEIVIIFIKSLSEYSFISVLCIPYACIVADFKSACQRKKELVLPYWFYYQWIKSILGIVSFRMRCDFFFFLYTMKVLFSQKIWLTADLKCADERAWIESVWYSMGCFFFCSNTQFWKMSW